MAGASEEYFKDTGGTPATTIAGGTPAKPSAAARPSTSTGLGVTPATAAARTQRAAWSREAVALGYAVDSVKHAAYVVLAAAGPAGMTVVDTADAATEQR